MHIKRHPCLMNLLTICTEEGYWHKKPVCKVGVGARNRFCILICHTLLAPWPVRRACCLWKQVSFFPPAIGSICCGENQGKTERKKWIAVVLFGSPRHLTPPHSLFCFYDANKVCLLKLTGGWSQIRRLPKEWYAYSWTVVKVKCHDVTVER